MICDLFQILQTLKELEKKGVPGQILTTNYLNFSKPRALEKLNSLANITLKMYDVEAADKGFHTKGYIFKKEETYRIIIGSSNITSAALTSNREWNTKLVSTGRGEITSLEKYRLQPNSMQVGFINNLKKIINAGEERALLISATGEYGIIMTGKNLKELGLEPVFFIYTGCWGWVNVAK